MRAVKHLTAVLLLATSASVLSAQQSPRPERGERVRPGRDLVELMMPGFDGDRAYLGIATSSSGAGDTLGLRIDDVTPDGPAAKAGLHAGDRLTAINGVNLRLSAADARDPDLEDVAARRLIRELSKVKPGDDVELRVWANGQSRTARVKTVRRDDLRAREREPRVTERAAPRAERSERAVLGMSLGMTASRRDTLGPMVMRVAPDGPADKAGIIEGDRIVSINGVDLRVPREDIEDGTVGSARVRRLTRELEKMKVGDDAELRVVSGTQIKTVRVKTVSAASLPRERGAFMFFGDGPFMGGPPPAIALPRIAPRVRVGPGPDVYRFDRDSFDRAMRLQLSPERQIEIERRVRDAMDRAQDAMRRARAARVWYDDERF